MTSSHRLRSRFFLFLAAKTLFATCAMAQDAPPKNQAPTSGAAQASVVAELPNYSDNPSGLKKLAKDILKAQKENDAVRADALLRSMVLPNCRQWYEDNFDKGASSRALPQYEASVPTLSAQLARFFLDSQQDGPTDIEAVRFDKDCDDNASEQTFNTLDARLKGVPLYELRFLNGNKFRRLFAFVYVDGAFRFILTPDFSAPAHTQLGGRAASGAPRLDPERVRLGGAIQAAKLINRVQPIYPEKARQERLSGTVRLHAVIAKDGGVQELRVMSGRCSLARAAVDAVRRWRYSPTLLMGEPVEVDTTIDVIFSLNY